jgi:hypothetical protein
MQQPGRMVSRRWGPLMSIHAVITLESKTAGQRNHGDSRLKSIHAEITLITHNAKAAGQRNHAAIHGIHATANHVSPQPFRGGETDSPWRPTPIERTNNPMTTNHTDDRIRDR